MTSKAGSLTARSINTAIGVWLFISAFLWPHSRASFNDTWIMGALCVLFALIAMSISTARYLNTALAVWLFIAVWALPHASAGTQWNNALCAVAILFLSLVPGRGEVPSTSPGRAAI